MNINYADSCNFKPIPAITPLDGYWQNGTWKFNMSEITAGAASQPSWIDVILKGNTALTLVNAKANGLNYVKLFGATEQVSQEYIDSVTLDGKCEQRNLPVGYTQVEYIESTGTQYINTGINPTSNKLQINCKMQRTTDVYSNFFGAVAGTSPRDGVRAYMQLETARMLVQSGTGSKTISFETGLEVLEMQITLINGGDATIVINGDTQTFSDVNTTLSTSMLIGAAKVGSSTNGIGTFKIWPFEIKKDDVQVFNGIPCKNSNNEYGLYDTVSGNFFVSESSDNFIGGNEAVPSPETPMDIICNNGVLKLSPNLFGGYTTETGYWQSNGTWSTDANYNSYQYITLKPNTTYTISNDVAPDYWRLTLFNGNTFSNRLLQQGGTSYTFTTNASENKISIAFNKNNISDVSKVQLEQGSTATPYMPYGQIYTDGTVETVEAIGKNLFDVDHAIIAGSGVGVLRNYGTYIENGIVYNGGKIGYNAGSGITIPISAGDYTISFVLNGEVASYELRAVTLNNPNDNIFASSTPIKSGNIRTLGNFSTTFTMPSGYTHVAMFVYSANKYGSWETNVMLEQGSTATEYEPYYNYGSATADNLLSVGNYVDTQEVLSGTVTRNVGVKILDGTESWGFSTTQYVANLILPDMAYGDGSVSWTINGLSTHYVGTTLANASMPVNSVKYSNTTSALTTARVFIKPNFTTLQEFKDYLSSQYANGTPVIIVYPLLTSTTENVNKQLLTKGNVMQTAGSLSGMSINTVSSIHTTPTPEQPLDINCNNGVVKLSQNLLNANVPSVSQSASPSSPISINFDKWYAGVAYNGYMTHNKVSSFSSGVGTITFTGADNSYGCARFFKLKPNTNYIVSCSSPTANHKCAIMCYVDNGNNTYTATTQIKTPSALPLRFTTNDNVVYGIVLYSPQDTSITYTSLQLEEGEEATTYRPYGTVYADGTTETVEITGKNLFDKNATNTNNGYIANGYLDTTGTFVSSSKYNVSEYIPVLSSTEYFWAISLGIASHNAPRVAFYTSDKTYISSGDVLAYGSSFTTPNNCAFIRVPIYKSTIDIEQLEQGSTATAYEPYFNGGTATAENLFKVGNYKDEQEVLTGSVTRNIGIMILNGLENWEFVSATYPYFRTITDIPTNSRTTANNELCTHCIPLNVGGSNTNQSISITKRSSAYSYLYLFARLDEVCEATSENLTIWKQWLADQYANGTPVIIVYLLATPTTETVTAQPLSIQAGTNIVGITQASMDNLELEVSYKAGVAVTITEVENAQLDNNVEVTING